MTRGCPGDASAQGISVKSRGVCPGGVFPDIHLHSCRHPPQVGRHPRLKRTTAAIGTYPTGMHSSLTEFHQELHKTEENWIYRCPKFYNVDLPIK